MAKYALLAAFAFLASMAPAAAQDAVSPELRQRAWYEDTLHDLARTLGGAHAIRLNCTAGDYTLFRFMEQIIAEESVALRPTLENAWNEGFRREGAMHPRCTSASQVAEQTLRDQGARLADGLAAANGFTPPMP
jgi:uncharacterized protein (TIGR02301 family)